MEKDTESKILDELKNINKSLHNMDKKINDIDSDGKPPIIIWDIIKSLLIGVFIVGPSIAVVLIIFQVISSWMFN
ncbi:hypothetical protein J2S78_000659 [Salibacterium salarium]|uniref:hypothetical protein n=1 Tax=Salibacterium salarium TaxID=284579 RepID=UPI00278A4C90|nr:hypothetical protein [Salibacterium salarium]MDQ0298251.1 hypothetical protein [Salibacterium salarium]